MGLLLDCIDPVLELFKTAAPADVEDDEGTYRPREVLWLQALQGDAPVEVEQLAPDLAAISHLHLFLAGFGHRLQRRCQARACSPREKRLSHARFAHLRLA